MISTICAIHRPPPPPATYALGRKRLDYVLGTPHVADALEKSEYEAFNSRFHSDHRAHFLDFNSTLLFGTDTQQLGTHKHHILKSKNVKQNTQYLKLVYNLLKQHNVFEQGNQFTYAGDRHQFTERLDRGVVAACLAAEKKLQQFGTPAWSVELAFARQKVTYLSKCITMAKTDLDHRNQLPPPEPQGWDQLAFIIPAILQEYVTQVKEVKRVVNKELVKTSYAHRDKELCERIRDLETSGVPADKKTATRLRRLRKAEDIKILFRKLRAFRNPDQLHGVTRDNPKSCTEWQQIEVPTDILYHLQKRNRQHVGQTHGLPFTVPPLSILR